MTAQKNGPKASAGARGKRYAREVVERPGEKIEMTDKEVVEMLENDGVSRIRKLARPHDSLAVDTLVDVCEDLENSAASRVMAARAILDYGHGKPAPVVSKTAGLGTGSGLRINILNFFGDDKQPSSKPVTIEVQAEELTQENPTG